MSTAIVTGSGGPDRLRVRRAISSSRATTWSASRTTCARSFFGAEASTGTSTTAARGADPAEFRSEALDIRDARRRRGVFAEHGRPIELVVHTAAQPSHDWAASDPQTDFSVNANGTLNLLEATRAAPPRRDVHLHSRPTRSTATRRTSCRSRSPSTRLELPEDHEYFGGIDTTMSIDGSHALAVRRLQGRRRPDGAGVRPLLRHADRLLPRRLPDRPPARRRAAARLPRLPDEVHRHRRPRTRSSATAASRCATTSTPTTSCAPSTPSTPRRAPAAVYNLGGGRGRTARCSRRSPLCERIAGRKLDWTTVATRRGSATTAGGSPTSRAFRARLPRSGS